MNSNQTAITRQPNEQTHLYKTAILSILDGDQSAAQFLLNEALSPCSPYPPVAVPDGRTTRRDHRQERTRRWAYELTGGLR